MIKSNTHSAESVRQDNFFVFFHPDGQLNIRHLQSSLFNFESGKPISQFQLALGYRKVSCPLIKQQKMIDMDVTYALMIESRDKT